LKLGLGTAQLGMAYGIHGCGRVPAGEANAILSTAVEAGIDTLDTAVDYGSSERVIGAFPGRDDCRIVTKIPELGGDAPASVVNDSIRESLQHLRISRIYGVLVHQVTDLLQPRGEDFWRALVELRERGTVSRIGVSVYSPDELVAVCKRFRPELVQLPLNLLDQRFLNSGLISRLRREGAEIHVRSVFLQGLLTLRPDERPAWTDRWRDVFRVLDERIAAAGMSATQACLRFALKQSEVDRVIVGVDSREQLQELIDHCACGNSLEGAEALACRDEDLLLPYRWPT